MSNQEPPVSVLIVDDRPEKLLALESVLSDLHLSIVRAESGRAALKQLLNRDFALILLDINMPGMDGFETASLIRQRKSCEFTPIIFVTAFGDETHVTRGYSLGAVDYILAPIVPEVLRTKVNVFLELFRKTAEVRQQAQRLAQRAEQLNRLNQAALAVNAALSIDSVLRVVVDSAARLVPVRSAALVMGADQHSPREKRVVWPSTIEDEEAGRLTSMDLQLLASADTDRPLRVAGSEFRAHLIWRKGNELDPSFALAESVLIVPLRGRDGRKVALLEMFDRADGPFTEDDEAILVQLAQMAAIAIENTLFAEAREANRIKDEFLATLSHELRTPLTAMLGWTQLLRLEGISPEENAHGLEVIERNVLSQAKLIDDLLDVSRIVTGKLRLNVRSIELQSVLQSAIEVIQPITKAKELSLDVDLGSSRILMMGDPDRLQQAVWNLLTNAVKFTSPGGQVRLTLDSANEHVLVRVADNGMGIHPNFLPFIFDRFRQGDSSSTRSHGGLGIGLALVRHVVELHGGTVAAESAGEAQGSTFTVVLPKVNQKLAANGTAPSLSWQPRSDVPVPQSDLSGMRIMVVDDEADAREIMSRTLERMGAEVTGKRSATEALESFESFRPDVLVSDIGMPIIDGYGLIRQVRQLPEPLRSVPAIALTAFAREEDRNRALQAGFQAHAAKPIEPDQLAAKVFELHTAARSGNSTVEHASK